MCSSNYVLRTRYILNGCKSILFIRITTQEIVFGLYTLNQGMKKNVHNQCDEPT